MFETGQVCQGCLSATPQQSLRGGEACWLALAFHLGTSHPSLNLLPNQDYLAHWKKKVMDSGGSGGSSGNA